ncbi:MAG: DUF924 domain-containing protein [Alphaproteobacteria bacterium]|nr:DUF924 domain-containing protein [Alphaproteobacteria bacterium]
MRDTRHEILHFWFIETDPILWFQNSPAFDGRVREQFSVIYDMAKDGLCNPWKNDADGALALCLVLDQFPRRIYRGAAAAYATDEAALLVAKEAVHRGFDQILPHEQRFFLYLPFEHSENMADQKRNLELFKSMEAANPLAYRTAQRHFRTFERFGRFPERNEALGRPSTEEEKRWLAEQVS